MNNSGTHLPTKSNLLVKPPAASLTKKGDGAYIITINGTQVASVNTGYKSSVLNNFRNSFLKSKYAKKNNITMLPEVVDETNEEPRKRKTRKSSNKTVGLVLSKPAVEPIQSKFDVNKRFEFLYKLTNMVIDGNIFSLILSGDAGMGKSYSITDILRSRRLKEVTDSSSSLGDYLFIKGFTTAKAMYRMFFNNNGKIIVFDDCDSAFRDADGAMILKSALDTSKQRKISWYSEAKSKEDSLPLEFIFEGKCLFITNIPSNQMSEALRSRSLVVDVCMNTDERLERMRYLMDDIAPEYTLAVKKDALAFMETNKERAKSFNLRTFKHVILMRQQAETDRDVNWVELAEFTIGL